MAAVRIIGSSNVRIGSVTTDDGRGLETPLTIRGKCGSCGHETSSVVPQGSGVLIADAKCPKCGSRDFTVSA